MAMESVYDLEVLVSIQDRITAPLKGIASQLAYTGERAKLMQAAFKSMGMATPQLKAMQTQLDAVAKANTFTKLSNDLKAAGLESSIPQLAAGLERVAAAEQKIAAGKALLTKGGMSIAAGIGLGVGALYEPIKQAMEMQQSMMGVKIATGANSAQLQQLTKNAMLGALQTGISSNMVASVQTALAQTKLPLSDILNPQLFNQYLKFSDMMYQRNGTDVQTSTKVAMESSHMFGLYNNPKQLSSFLNQLWKTSATSPIPLQNIGNILSYFGGTANGVGLSANSALQMVNYLATSGLAGSGRSGGSDLMQFIEHSMNPSTAAAQALMEKYGLMSKSGASVFYKDGHFADLQQQIAIMQQFSKQFGGNKQAMINAINKIFATTGGRYALSLAESNAPTLYGKINSSTNAVANIDTAQGEQMNTAQGQLSRLKQGFSDMMVGIGLPQLSSLMNMLKSINGIVSKIVTFEVSHPLFMKSIGNVIKLTAEALIFKGAIQSIVGVGKMLNGAFMLTKLFGDFTKLGGAAKFLIQDWGAFGGTLKIVGRSIGILGGWIGRITGLQKIWTAATAAYDVVADANPIGLICVGIAALIGLVVVIIAKWRSVVDWCQKLWSWFKNLGVGVQLLITAFAPFIVLPATIIAHWSQIISWFSALPAKMESIGHNVVTGIWQGIVGMTGWFKSNIMSWVDDLIPGSVRKILDIHSPSRVMAQIGQYVVQGMYQGMTSNSHLISQASTQMANNAIPNVSGIMSSRGSIGTQHIEININGYNKDKKELANYIFKELGRASMRSNMSTGIYPNKLNTGPMTV